MKHELKALIVSDVHSNLEAFRSAIADAERRGGFDEIWSLGDLVGYGPDPVAVIELLRQHDHKAVVGNHDLAAIGKLSTEAFNPHATHAAQWTAEQLGEDQQQFLLNQPMKLRIDDFTLVHGSPRDPVWEYVVSTSSAVANFAHFDTLRCLLGHSHIPFVCRPKGENSAEFLAPTHDEPLVMGTDKMIVNPGSVGQPRDGDAKASYAVYDTTQDSMTHHRAEYGIPATQDRMREFKLPDFLIDRLTYGR